MRPNKLNQIKAEQAESEEAEQAPIKPKKAAKKTAARRTKLDAIKAKSGDGEASKPAKGVSKLRDIKTAQLEKDPTAYDVKTHVASAPAVGDLFEQLQAALVTDIARIKTHKKLADKQALKATLLPNYLPFVEQYISEGHDYPNNVAVMAMVWALDIGDIETGMDIAAYLIETKQTLPANFKCDIPTLLCRCVYDWANDQLKTKQSAQPYLDQLLSLLVTHRWELPVAVESMMYVIAAKHAFEQGDFKACVEWCADAEKANPDGAGVKTLKAKAIKEMAIKAIAQ